MTREDEVWARAWHGDWVWPWQRRLLSASADVERCAALARAMVDLPTPGQRANAAAALRLVASDVPGAGAVGRPEVIGQLLRALVMSARGAVTISPIDDPHDARIFDTARGLLATNVTVARPALLALLAASPGTVLAWAGTERASAEAKLAAMRVMAGQFIGQDTGLLMALLTNDDEPETVRFAAACHLLRTGGVEVAEPVANWLLVCHHRPPNDLHLERSSIRSAMVGTLISALHHDPPDRRLRARQLLEAVGDVAVPALARVVAESTSWAARHHAEELLAVYDRAALRTALAQRRADGRSLSLAEPADADAARGLSPTAEPRA